MCNVQIARVYDKEYETLLNKVKRTWKLTLMWMFSAHTACCVIVYCGSAFNQNPFWVLLKKKKKKPRNQAQLLSLVVFGFWAVLKMDFHLMHTQQQSTKRRKEKREERETQIQPWNNDNDDNNNKIFTHRKENKIWKDDRSVSIWYFHVCIFVCKSMCDLNLHVSRTSTLYTPIYNHFFRLS